MISTLRTNHLYLAPTENIKNKKSNRNLDTHTTYLRTFAIFKTWTQLLLRVRSSFTLHQNVCTYVVMSPKFVQISCEINKSEQVLNGSFLFCLGCGAVDLACLEQMNFTQSDEMFTKTWRHFTKSDEFLQN